MFQLERFYVFSVAAYVQSGLGEISIRSATLFHYVGLSFYRAPFTAPEFPECELVKLIHLFFSCALQMLRVITLALDLLPFLAPIVASPL